ncbi:hypothetical protein PUR71_35840 [Streptomyces sp. SP17BM10]|nr:hypothetical protein [Streptomyces sp. SP17BM10]MEE1788231.1 hypothetical protein [Streptomyces sp. SP17BM10]
MSTLSGEAWYVPPRHRAGALHGDHARHVVLVVTDPGKAQAA